LGTTVILASMMCVIAQVVPVIAGASGTWGTAIEVPGLASLNTSGDASVTQVSCGSPGNCSAVGSYAPATNVVQAFVANEVKGTWNSAGEVPGSSALNKDNGAFMTNVKCSSTGNCSAAGFYTAAPLIYRVMVESEDSGKWRNATRLLGTTAFNRATYANVTVLACASVGNCSVAGEYLDHPNYSHVFLANEVHGHWEGAFELPGTALLNAEGNDEVGAMSCPSVGNCSAGGEMSTSTSTSTAFVVSEVHGTWGRELTLPGVGALAKDGNAIVNSVSCPSAGNCTAVGTYNVSAVRQGVFMANEVHGHWMTATELAGTKALSHGYAAQSGGVSCPSVGTCTTAGSYAPKAHDFQAYVADEVHGVWSNAVEAPGTAALNTGGNAGIGPLDCPSVGNCSAGGSYKSASTGYQAFVIDEVHGKWSAAESIPGFVALDPGGDGGVYSLSCARAGSCVAAGAYSVTSPTTQAFVVSERGS
jgi:hypothetical protein